MTPTLDRPAPHFELPATGGETVRLGDLRGETVVLYFYPRDNTPGCTQQGQDFRDRHQDFRAAGARILGVSRDSVRKHENFRSKHDFPFPLLADEDEAVCHAYGVLKEKKLYGKAHVGIERSTFLIDADGVLRREWRGIRVKGHVDEVLAAVRAF